MFATSAARIPGVKRLFTLASKNYQPGTAGLRVDHHPLMSATLTKGQVRLSLVRSGIWIRA
jgi:hypothetical protein